MIEGHRLVSTGAFGGVRHPIYTAMLGLLIATGIVATAWPALTFGIAAYCAGLRIRIRAEKELLHDEFGAEYEEYAAHVPAVIPHIVSIR